ncbi:hypothetical protein J5N97_014544 [Dioscorea zingiberensis]|uniref:Guanylate kinase n=1 Tax=Dioscorea zingiberensis TaxID=325984 RepID=A0A9D5CSL0_9LILI|nr:hypothetical protein J5N97_014544 [Dioscorea zingiberensis]
MLLVRVATAREEVKRMKDFDYVVVNAEGKLDKAVKLVESIIDAEKARVGSGESCDLVHASGHSAFPLFVVRVPGKFNVWHVTSNTKE